MEESDDDIAKLPPSLKSAVRRARIDQAERSDVVAELRRAELVRLDLLLEAFKPIAAQIPPQVEMFDVAIAAGERPRLFVDMIAFVEMGHDRRTYRFVQETRNGRVTLAEAERIDDMVEAMTDYVARRLVEREQALAADIVARAPPPPQAAPLVATPPPQAPAAQTPAAQTPAGKASVSQDAVVTKGGGWRRAVARTTLFMVELLGALALFVLILGALYVAWRMGANWWVASFEQVR